jgi:hypothetical protein
MKQTTNQNIIELFINESKFILHDILEESGALLYSSKNTLCKGNYYFLGLNPKIDDKNISYTLSRILEELKSYEGNAYLDEDWGKGKGKHPIQLNLNNLANHLGQNLVDICSSNLIFTRTQNQHNLNLELAKKCWKVHEKILEIVQPKTLFIYGNGKYNSTLSYMKEIIGINKIPKDYEKFKRSNLYYYELKDFNIIASGHLSWPAHKLTDEKLEWISKRIL